MTIFHSKNDYFLFLANFLRFLEARCPEVKKFQKFLFFCPLPPTGSVHTHFYGIKLSGFSSRSM